MTWKIREASAIFVLVVVVTTAGHSCDTSRALTITPNMLSGNDERLHLALSSGRLLLRDIGHFGAKFTPVKINNEDWIYMEWFYTGESSATRCGKFTGRCQITGKTCSNDYGIEFFVMAQDNNYLVLYTPRERNNYTLDIYVRNYVDNAPLTVNDLPYALRNAIMEKCGVKYGQERFFPRRFPPGNFISHCQSIDVVD